MPKEIHHRYLLERMYRSRHGFDHPWEPVRYYRTKFFAQNQANNNPWGVYYTYRVIDTKES